MSKCHLWGFVQSTLFVGGLLLMAICDDISCLPGSESHHQTPKVLKALSSMKPYRYNANLDSSPIRFDGCHATRFWGLFRHGTRNPNKKQIVNAKEILLPLRDKVIENFYAGKGLLSASDISLIKDWTFDLTEDDALSLTEEGAREHVNLGRRFKSRFPELFSKPYDERYYEIYHTAAVRTEHSASNFSLGVFGKEYKSKIKYKGPSESRSFLRFCELCDKYLEEVKKSKNAKSEGALFKIGPEIRKVTESVSERLGFDETLSVDTVLLMYVFCAFNTAWVERSTHSAWCSPFAEDDMAVIEYLRDLKHMAVHGYKYKITYKQACPVLKNAFGFFSSKVAEPVVKLNFAHSDVLLKFLTRLGLYKDSRPLLATNYHLNVNRKWKGSVIDSFSSNLVFVLFDCGNEKNVLTLHQEKAITLPGCPETRPLCPLKTILKSYKHPIQNCNFKGMCAVKNRTSMWSLLTSCFRG